MVKKHPILCLSGWFLLCLVVYILFTLGNVNFAGLLFFFYLYDHGAKLICREFERRMHDGVNDVQAHSQRTD